MPRFRIHRLVEIEFEEVHTWYAGRSPLAAEHFIHAFDVSLDKIERHPTAHAPWRPPFRRVRLTRYPYLVVYHVDRRMTSVLALVHERREPVRTFATLVKRASEFS